jgi:hypothetical protein
VCCIANSPGPFLRSALAELRDIADEIVIAAGGPVDADDLCHYAELADRLFAIEFDYIERHLAWLHAQCRGDWILRLDGDEIPSREMIGEVTAARESGAVTGVFFARRNLFPTIDSYISQEPWYPDFQLRLVRNDASLRFQGLQHSGAERTLPARIVEAPIYHLALVLADADERRSRAERYEALRPGLVAPTGLPARMLELPEAVGHLLTARVPADDVRAIETILSARVAPAPDDASAAQSVTLAETDAYWAGRVVAEAAYRARLEVVGDVTPLAPSERRPFYFRVSNDGSERWGWDPAVGPYVHVVHRIVDEALVPVCDWVPSFFTETVRPGATTIVPAYVDSPSTPGRYRLQLRVRHAPDRLFGDAEERELVVRPGGAWGGDSSLRPDSAAR